MTPAVTIDARMLGATGIGTYVSELLAGLASTDHEFRVRLLCAPQEAVHPGEPRQKGLAAQTRRRGECGSSFARPNFSMAGLLPESFEFVRATAPIYGLREQWEIARLARDGDLLHCPHYNTPYFYKGRMVVTIHDLTHLAHRDFVPNRLAYYYARIMLKAAARCARRVITVSQFSKKHICQALNVPEEKVHVIAYGIPQRILPNSPVDASLIEKVGIVKPYILFVGLLKPHKNVQALLRAFALLPEPLRTSHQLVIAGKLDNCYPALSHLVRELMLSERVVFTGHVTDDELCALYSGARAFVLPSLNEGYGLPVLEAMAYGVPVIVSKTSSLPEVAGDAGILVDPCDYQSISKALECLLSDDKLRRSLGERGRKRAQSFSARDFALKHLEVYRAALT
jgi:glycosyltransferase involved in cell wall biosynthesis